MTKVSGTESALERRGKRDVQVVSGGQSAWIELIGNLRLI